MSVTNISRLKTERYLFILFDLKWVYVSIVQTRTYGHAPNSATAKSCRTTVDHTYSDHKPKKNTHRYPTNAANIEKFHSSLYPPSSTQIIKQTIHVSPAHRDHRNQQMRMGSECSNSNKLGLYMAAGSNRLLYRIMKTSHTPAAAAGIANPINTTIWETRNFPNSSTFWKTIWGSGRRWKVANHDVGRVYFSWHTA